MRIAYSAMIHGLILFILSLMLMHLKASAEEVQLPEDLKPAMEHLLALVGDTTAESLDERHTGNLIEYVAAPKDMHETYSMGLRKGAVSNYYEFKLARPFQEVLDLIYHPDIPSFISVPSSVRLSQWIEINGQQQPLPRITMALANLTEPMIVNGVEFVENTPDTYSGAYYAYELDRTLILMKHQGRRILISISRQRDKSTVGKKGLVIGADEEWNYLYTGEKGCTRAGLGWVDSYMYRSESIMVYYETSDPDPQVKCGVFKWLHAGWAGINLAQPVDLRKGIQRFVKSFKTVIEAPAIQASDQLAGAFRRIDNLPTETLRQKARDHFALLKSKYEDSSKRSKKWFERLFKNDQYFQGLQREELKALISKAYLKFLLGKEQGVDISSLSPEKRPG